MDEMSEMFFSVPTNCSILEDGTLPIDCSTLATTQQQAPAVATDELDLLKYAASPVPLMLNGDPWRILCEQIFFYGLPMIIVSGFIFSFSAVMALSRQLDSSTEVYLFTLALSNWFLLTTAGILNIENYTGRQNIIQRIQIYCRALHEWLWYVSCWMVIVMTIECLVTVCQKRLTSLCSKSQALVLTVLVYATCLISVLPEFWAYEVRTLTDTNTNTTIYRMTKTSTLNSMEYTVMYYWYIQSITFLIPYPLLLITAGVILRNGGTRCRIITTTIPAANAQINARGTGIIISTNGAPSPRLCAMNGKGNGQNYYPGKKNTVKNEYKNIYDGCGANFLPQSSGNNLLVTIRQPDSEVQLNRSIIAVSICYAVLTLPHVATQFLLRNFGGPTRNESSANSDEVFAPIALMQGSQLVFKLFFYAQFGVLFLLLVCHMERFRQSLARVCCSCCLGDDAFDDCDPKGDVAAIEPIARLDLTDNYHIKNGFMKAVEAEQSGALLDNAPSWLEENGSLKPNQYQNGGSHYETNTLNGSLKVTKPLKPIIKNSRTPQAKCASPSGKQPAYQQENEANNLMVMQSTV